MSIKVNPTFPSLQELTSYVIVKEAPQHTLNCNSQSPDTILTCVKQSWDSLKEGASQSIGPNHIMQNLEKELLKYYYHYSEKYEIYSVDLSADEKEILLINNVTILFQSLAKKIGVSLNYIDWQALRKRWETEAFNVMWKEAICPTHDEIKTITTLNLSAKQIKALPSEMRNFKRISVLILEHNEIKCIPDYLGHLPNLTTLVLGNNHITCIPDSIDNCNNLKLLDLSHNEITIIPEALAKLTELNQLNLDNNKISKVPSSLLSLKKLERLTLYRNPLFLHFNIYEPKHDGLYITNPPRPRELSIQKFLAQMVSLNEYKCTGNFSNFIRLTLSAFSLGRHEDIKIAFNKHLDLKEKNFIREAYVSLMQSCGNFEFLRDADLWEDMHTFCEACIRAITLKFKKLSPDEMKFICNLMEKMEEPDPSSNILLISDAMEELDRFDLKNSACNLLSK